METRGYNTNLVARALIVKLHKELFDLKQRRDLKGSEIRRKLDLQNVLKSLQW